MSGLAPNLAIVNLQAEVIMRVNFFQLSAMSDEQRRRLYRGRGVNLKDLIPRVVPIIEAVRARGDDAIR